MCVLQVFFTVLPLSQTWMGENGYCVPAILTTNVTEQPAIVQDPAWADAYKWHEKHLRGHEVATWVEGTTTSAENDVRYVCVPPDSMYVASMYWAVMTITSIGARPEPPPIVRVATAATRIPSHAYRHTPTVTLLSLHAYRRSARHPAPIRWPATRRVCGHVRHRLRRPDAHLA